MTRPNRPYAGWPYPTWDRVDELLAAEAKAEPAASPRPPRRRNARKTTTAPVLVGPATSGSL